jgi:hypothetical protein
VFAVNERRSDAAIIADDPCSSIIPQQRRSNETLGIPATIMHDRVRVDDGVTGRIFTQRKFAPWQCIDCRLW